VAAARVVTAAEATLYGPVIAGVFALLGVMVERLLRLLGRLRFEASGWERDFYGGEDDYTFGIIPDEDAEKEATQVRYRTAITLFNGKEVPTGLQDIAIVLVRDDGKRSPPSRPCDLTTGRRDQLHGKTLYTRWPRSMFRPGSSSTRS
jgi:hypothetical protein